ncbi:MAG: shikimate dehydrogenase [Bacillota bacterium]
MDKFAFIIHPLKLEDYSKKFNWVKKVPDNILKSVARVLPPFKVSHITGIKSRTGRKVEGYFVACPLTSKQMLTLPEKEVINKIIKTGKKAESLGVDIIGLGAFTSVVGDKGITVAQNLDTPVTTGNTYTVATAIEGTEMAVKKMKLDLKKETTTVIGATGSIGRTASILMAEKVNKMILAARNIKKLSELKKEIKAKFPDMEIEISSNVKNAVSKSRVIISASGSADTLVEPEDLLSRSVICDVARPRDVAARVEESRDDVLVIEGGIVKVPGDVNFNFDFGYPPGTSYACMAETIILTLEKMFFNYTLGPKVELDKVKEMWSLAEKHGFKVVKLRKYSQKSFAKELLYSEAFL